MYRLGVFGINLHKTVKKNIENKVHPGFAF